MTQFISCRSLIFPAASSRVEDLCLAAASPQHVNDGASNPMDSIGRQKHLDISLLEAGKWSRVK